MPVALQTRFIGATNTKPARVKAWVPSNAKYPGQSLTRTHDSDLGQYEAHLAVAKALCDKMKWTGTIAGGAVPGGYVWVFVENSHR